MTPQERQLVTELFDRLAQLEDNPRDPDAEDLIADLWEQAPNASYALVQSVIVQDEALKRANTYIEELESQLGVEPEQPQQGGSFLDSMRERISGGGGASARGSVPSVRSGDQPMGAPDLSRSGGQPDSRWNTGGTQYPPRDEGSGSGGSSGGSGGGGGFLGGAGAAAAGVVGGALLMHGIKGLMGGSGGSAQAKAFEGGAGSSGGGGELAKEAGLNDIGRSPSGSADDRAGALDTGDGGDFDGEGDYEDDADFDDDAEE